MAHAATMNREIFSALRDSGMEEKYAARVAEAVPPADSLATKADIADLRAAMPERENLAARSEVAVLQNEMTDVKAAIIRIDESIAGIKETAARTDEKVNALQTQNRLFIIPLHLLTLGALFGLLTKGILWAVAP